MSSDSIVRIVTMGPSGGGKSALVKAIISGQSAKGQTFPTTKEATEQSVRVPITYEGQLLNVKIILTDMPGDEDFLTAALTKNPKAFIEADLGLLLVPPTDKSSYIAAAKHLDRFKRTSPHGKVICYLSKCDQTKQIDGKTAHSIKAWCSVPERERVLACESLSSFDTSSEQIQELLKHIALEAHKMSLVRLAAEAEELRASAGAAKACCVVA